MGDLLFIWEEYSCTAQIEVECAVCLVEVFLYYAEVLLYLAIYCTLHLGGNKDKGNIFTFTGGSVEQGRLSPP